MKQMFKQNSIIIILLLLFSFALTDENKILLEVESEIKKAKAELLKWDKTKSEQDLLLAIEILKNARIIMNKLEVIESIRAIDDNKELTMLYFWANKSKRVGDVTKDKKDLEQYKKSFEQAAKEDSKNTTKDNINSEANKNAKTLDSLLTNNIKFEEIIIPEEHIIITTAFQKAIEFSKNNPNQLYECEFMFRDIYYDFPTSKSAVIANDIANKYSEKIEIFVKEKLIFRNFVKSKIPNYETEYINRNYDAIITSLTAMRANEKDAQKQDIYWEMIEEFKYLQTAIAALNDLLFLKKNDAPPASIVGIKFRGFITGSSKKGLDITTDEMGGMSIPWIKVSDEQLGKLLAVLSKGIDVTYKIPIAIHLLGNTQDAFQLLYQRSLDNPLVMAKYSRFYFQALFYFRKEMSGIIDQQIETAQKLFTNKDTAGAIGVLTQSLLSINKNNFLRDQIGKIHEAISALNN